VAVGPGSEVGEPVIEALEDLLGRLEVIVEQVLIRLRFEGKRFIPVRL